MTALIANARMYSVSHSAREDWKRLLDWVVTRAGLHWRVIDYDAPAPLAALWARNDLGAVMMCGLPFAQRLPRPQLLAAPRPVLRRYGNQPIYFTDLVVADHSPYRTLEDTFGTCIGYTLADSMSGGVALRHYLMPYRAARGGERLYRKALGNLINARGVIAALVAGEIDIGPLDSYYHALLHVHDPALASRVRVIATTPPMPIPPVISTAMLDAQTLERVRAAFREVETSDELASLRARLLLAGFALPAETDYEQLAAIANRPMPAFEAL